MTIEMENAQIRRQFDIEYSELRSQFINTSKQRLTTNDISTLKTKYSNVINSSRTCDYINTIEELLRILEKRGVLCYDNIEILKYISSNYLRDEYLDRSLRIYEGRVQRPSLPPHNRYLMQSDGATRSEAQPTASGMETLRNAATQRQAQPVRMELYTTQPAFRMTLLGSIDVESANRNAANDPSEVMRKVFIEVSNKLGRNWRDVARYLRVTECEIDEINSQNLSLNEKALKALLKFQSKCEPLQWKLKLKRALLDARRRDLMELVDELLP